MVLHPTSELIWGATLGDYRRDDDATIDDAILFHSELLDRLAMEVRLVRTSSRSDAKKSAMIEEITARAEYHRDMVDRLTDIVETNRQLIWMS